MILHLPSLLNVIVDFVAWFIIHVFVSLFVARIPYDSFRPDSWLYKERKLENSGRLYTTFFKINKWKELLPDGAAVFKGGFRKKRLGSSNSAYLRRFILETCRAELTHWGIFVFCPVFFIWNDWWIGLVMIAYAILVNIPCIITQRYNRIRLRKLYKARDLLLRINGSELT